MTPVLWFFLGVVCAIVLIVLVVLGPDYLKQRRIVRDASLQTQQLDAPIPATVECPWYQSWFSWARRHYPVFLIVTVALALLFSYRYLYLITYWSNDAASVNPTQVNLDGSQIIAETQAGGQRQLGAVWTVLLSGTLYFGVVVTVVWQLMGFITPALPTWAKKYFSKAFKNVGDEGYEADNSLPIWQQFIIHLVVWFGLLFLYAACLAVAASVQ